MASLSIGLKICQKNHVSGEIFLNLTFYLPWTEFKFARVDSKASDHVDENPFILRGFFVDIFSLFNLFFRTWGQLESSFWFPCLWSAAVFLKKNNKETILEFDLRQSKQNSGEINQIFKQGIVMLFGWIYRKN